MTEPLFVPTEAGARDVLRRARRRRRRQAALAAAVVAATVVVSSLLALPAVGRGADRISVVPASPSPGTTAVPAPAPDASAGVSSPALSQGVTGRPGRSRPGSTPATVFAGPASPADSPTPTAPARRHSAASPITRTTVAFTSQCDATNDLAGWCEVYTGPSTARRKHPVSLSMELCRLPVAGDGQVSLDDSREINLSVDSSSGTQQWRAGQGVKNTRHQHTVTVRAGTCLHWAATWDTIASDGFYAPPGTYDIGYGLDSSDVTDFTSGIALALTD